MLSLGMLTPFSRLRELSSIQPNINITFHNSRSYERPFNFLPVLTGSEEEIWSDTTPAPRHQAINLLSLEKTNFRFV